MGPGNPEAHHPLGPWAVPRRLVAWAFVVGVAVQLLVNAVGIWPSDPTIGWRGRLAYGVANWVPRPEHTDPPLAFQVLFWSCMLASAGLLGVVAGVVGHEALRGIRL